VKTATALETILGTTKGGLVTPSILSQIAEGAALLLGKDPEHRMQIDRRVRHLYGIRSAIVHQGGGDVERYDVEELFELGSSVLSLLLGPERPADIRTVDDLDSHIRRYRYR
jgi:hypothetical protein